MVPGSCCYKGERPRALGFSVGVYWRSVAVPNTPNGGMLGLYTLTSGLSEGRTKSVGFILLSQGIYVLIILGFLVLFGVY